MVHLDRRGQRVQCPALDCARRSRCILRHLDHSARRGCRLNLPRQNGTAVLERCWTRTKGKLPTAFAVAGVCAPMLRMLPIKAGCSGSPLRISEDSKPPPNALPQLPGQRLVLGAAVSIPAARDISRASSKRVARLIDLAASFALEPACFRCRNPDTAIWGSSFPSPNASSANRKSDDPLALRSTTWTTAQCPTEQRFRLHLHRAEGHAAGIHAEPEVGRRPGSNGRFVTGKSRSPTRIESCFSALSTTIPFAPTKAIKPTNSKTEALSNLWTPGAHEAQAKGTRSAMNGQRASPSRRCFMVWAHVTSIAPSS